MDLANVDLNTYYSNITNQTGETLKLALRTTIQTGFSGRTYGEARGILAVSDRNPQNFNKLIGIYDSYPIVNYWIKEQTNPDAWQREHVWPQSKLNATASNSTANIASDLHNLRAITGINQTRSNRYFDIASGPGPSTIGTDAWYPGDDHKGDVARILFYMIVMYPQLDLTDIIAKLTVNDTYMGKYEVLLNWHLEDPVDEFEMRRNNFIYSGVAIDPETGNEIYAIDVDKGNQIAPQGNRNPFIDRPYYLQWLLKDGYPTNITTMNNQVDFTGLAYAPYVNTFYN